MNKREKVARGLECCWKCFHVSQCPDECPYKNSCSESIFMPLIKDARELLKEQEPAKWYGSYILFPAYTTQEEIENAAKEQALKTLIEMGALQIIVNMDPQPIEDDGNIVNWFVTGGWKIKLPKED